MEQKARQGDEPEPSAHLIATHSATQHKGTESSSNWKKAELGRSCSAQGDRERLSSLPADRRQVSSAMPHMCSVH